MATKLNLATPEKDIIRTLDEEEKKALYWFNKRRPNSDKERQELSNMILDDPAHIPRLLPAETYESAAGNKWVVFGVGRKLRNAETVRFIDIVVCYYETVGSIGIFFTNESKTDGKTYQIYNSHYFLRYKQRMNLPDLEGLDILYHYFLNNPVEFMPLDPDIQPYYKYKGQKCCNMLSLEGVGYCKMRSEKLIEASTFLNFGMIQESEKRRLNKLCSEFLAAIEVVDYLNEEQCKALGLEPEKFDNDTLEKSKDGLPEYAKEDVYRFGHLLDFRQPDDYTYNSCVALYAILAKVFGMCIGEKPFYDDVSEILDTIIALHNRCYRKSFGDAQKQMYWTAQKFNEKYKLHIKEKQLWDAFEDLANTTVKKVKQETKEQQTMTDIILNNFKRVLKDAGAKNFESLAKGAFNMNYNRYIEIVEPIYAISRVMHAVNTEKDTERLTKANKVWMTMLVEQDWCPQLRPYTDKYGKELVSLAIDYAIDNGLWTSPKGDAALKSKPDNHWDGLKVIDETVQYLIDEDPTLASSLPKTEEQLAEEDLVDTPVESMDFGDEGGEVLFCSPEYAESALLMMGNSLAAMQKNMRYLAKFIADNKNPQEALKEAEEKAKKYESVKEAMNRYKDKAEKMRAEYEGAQARYNEKSRKLAASERDVEKYMSLYENVQLELEGVKRQLTEANEKIEKLKEGNALPSKKVIRLSELLACPIIGQAAVKSLTPLFERKGIVVDINH